jgi:hypothetical protein
MRGTQAELTAKLQDANKKLRGEVRALRKRLSAAIDELALLQDIWQSEIMDLKKIRKENIKKKKAPVCPRCGNPTLDIRTVGVWTLTKCEACDYFDRTN